MVGLKQIYPHTHIDLEDRLEANYTVSELLPQDEIETLMFPKGILMMQ